MVHPSSTRSALLLATLVALAAATAAQQPAARKPGGGGAAAAAAKQKQDSGDDPFCTKVPTRDLSKATGPQTYLYVFAGEPETLPCIAHARTHARTRSLAPPGSHHVAARSTR